MSDPGRQPSLMQSAPGARTTIDGVVYDYYGGCGYLGLQAHPEVIEAGVAALRQYGVHSATSRTRYASEPVLVTEATAARFFGTERAFYIASGYISTPLLLKALEADTDVICLDSDSHYCLTEAAAASPLPVLEFASRDAADLGRQLGEHLGTGQRPLVLSDGVFASTGAIAPVDHYLDVLADYPGAVILVDDAHGFGTLGGDGRGTLDHFGRWHDANRMAADPTGTRLFAGGTLSKALGGHGGIIPGDQALFDAVTTAAHLFDGASVPAAPVAGASTRALEIVMAEPQLRAQLRHNVARVRDRLRGFDFDNIDAPTPIVGFTCGTARDMRALHRQLAKAGILVPYASAYSGLGAEGAMRLAVFATHTDAMLDRLFETLGQMQR